MYHEGYRRCPILLFLLFLIILLFLIKDLNHDFWVLFQFFDYKYDTSLFRDEFLLCRLDSGIFPLAPVERGPYHIHQTIHRRHLSSDALWENSVSFLSVEFPFQSFRTQFCSGKMALWHRQDPYILQLEHLGIAKLCSRRSEV